MGFLSRLRKAHRLRVRFFLTEDKSAKTPEMRLIEAIKHDDPMAVKALLESGADTHHPDEHEHRDWPIRLACFHGNLQIVAMLCDMGADVNAQNLIGPGAPLRIAARRRHQPVVRYLLKRGAYYSKNIISSLPTDRIELIHREVDSLKQRARKPEAPPPPRVENAHLLQKIKAVESEVRRDLSMTIWPETINEPEDKKQEAAPAPRPPLILKTRAPSSVLHATPDISLDSMGLNESYGIDTNLLDLEMIERAGRDDAAEQGTAGLNQIAGQSGQHGKVAPTVPLP